MKKNIKVSIVLSSYNHEKYIKKAIDSALNQTFSDFELIIWDDASSDTSWQIISSYTDPRIRAFRNEKNLGGGNAKKAITEIAVGEYIAIHHSDDIWEPDKLEKQVAFLDANPEIGAVFSQAQIIDENGDPFKDEKNFYFKIFDQPNRSRFEWLNRFFYKGNALCHPSALVRKQYYDECGTYRLGLAQLPDLDMWVRLCLKYEIHVLPEKLVRYRVRENNSNTSSGRPETRIRTRFELLQVYDHYSSIQSPDEIMKIFPDYAHFIKPDGYDIGFILAMAALDEKENNLQIRELFALNLLFDIFNSPERAQRVKALYDFEHKDYIGLTAKYDVFALDQITGQKQTIWKLTNQVNERDQTIQKFGNQITERDRKIQHLAGQVNERDHQVDKLSAQFAESSQRVKQLTSQVIEINSSKTWKIASAINRVVDKIVPPRSRRRRAIKKFIAILAYPYNKLVKGKKLKNEIAAVKASGLFDADYYNKKYPDVAASGVDPFSHYLLYGWKEGRNPSLDFNTRLYLEQNPDVMANGINPLVHYALHGKNEGRKLKPEQPLNSGFTDLNFKQTNYFSYSEIIKNLLLTNQQLKYPYSETEHLAIGVMESLKYTLANKYINMPQDIKVSIIMPTYNRANIIKEALDSVIQQKYENWELIIVDDNSKDATDEVVKAYQDSRIKYIKNNKNLGSAGARNLGIEHVTGDYVCYLDSDNQLDEDFLLIMANELKTKPQYDVMYCALRMERAKSTNSHEEVGIRFSIFNRPTIENHNFVDIGVVFHRKECLERVKFNGSMRRLADWDFILKLTEEKLPYAVPCILLDYFYDKAENQNTLVESYQAAEKQIDEYLITDSERINIKSSAIDVTKLYSPKVKIFTDKTYPVSIVIPSFNCLEYLELCLQAIKQFTGNIQYEIIIVDNQSNSDVISFLQKKDGEDHIRVIFNQSNFGFTRAVNQGILAAKPQNDIVLLNNDTLVTRNWIEAFQEVISFYPQTGLIVPTQIALPGERTLLTHRPLNNKHRELDVNISYFHRNVVDANFDPERGYIEVNFAPFFCTYIPRETINDVGLLDENLGVHYYSDHFYCDSIRELTRKKIIYTPKSKVYHFIQRSTDEIKNKNFDYYKDMMAKRW